MLKLRTTEFCRRLFKWCLHPRSWRITPPSSSCNSHPKSWYLQNIPIFHIYVNITSIWDSHSPVSHYLERIQGEDFQTVVDGQVVNCQVYPVFSLLSFHFWELHHSCNHFLRKYVYAQNMCDCRSWPLYAYSSISASSTSRRANVTHPRSL